ncbi:MAG: tetratricopeptide repeat protein [Acidobacteriota bacterium]|nr:tetratricopeptide repeat protein [Acidobacteriota bacterium]MDE2965464.1 tetratricopeptide repeat protein [Acidobacteriota bacterium]
MVGGSLVRPRRIRSQQQRRLRPQWFQPLGLAASLAVLAGVVLAEEVSVTDLLTQARSAYRSGDHTRAISLATRAVELDPQNPQGFHFRGQLYEMQGRHRQAIADYDAVLKLNPDVVEVYNRRGSEHFKLGHIEASIADFDRAIELNPGQEPYHWQRGISYYYAGLFEKGRAQFQSHQQVNANDVENAVWHFLCGARLVGVTQARQSLLDIEGDRRVPMMEIYRLFRGEGTIDEVMRAARGGDGDPAVRNRQLFYAHLYLGLYHEALGDETEARRHLVLAADRYPVNHYMGDVARVHADRLRQQ